MWYSEVLTVFWRCLTDSAVAVLALVSLYLTLTLGACAKKRKGSQERAELCQIEVDSFRAIVVSPHAEHLFVPSPELDPSAHWRPRARP